MDVWIEVDCPRCGIDVDLMFLGADECYICHCGHPFTSEELAKGNVCESMPEVGRVYTHLNPWREVPRETKN